MPISSRAGVMNNLAAGKGSWLHMQGVGSGSFTGAAALSGNVSASLSLNAIGTTVWTTRKGFPINTETTGPQRLVHFVGQNTRANTSLLARFYQMGTATFTTTVGDRFTPDAATFPVLDTRLGVASTAVPLFPVMLVTTATATTAPQFTMNYTDQDGNASTTKNFTFPAAVTAVGSCFILPMAEGDTSIRTVTSITCTVAGTAGTVAILGMEILAGAVCNLAGANTQFRNAVIDPSLTQVDEHPSTAGTFTSFLSVLQCGNSAITQSFNEVLTVLDV
jgi:hypothetical protein